MVAIKRTYSTTRGFIKNAYTLALIAVGFFTIMFSSVKVSTVLNFVTDTKTAYADYPPTDGADGSDGRVTDGSDGRVTDGSDSDGSDGGDGESDGGDSGSGDSCGCDDGGSDGCE
jgi:hypothetical protein